MRLGNRDITFLFSLCCSLIINTGIVEVVVLRAQPPSVLDISNWSRRPNRASSPITHETAFIPAPQPPPPIEKKIDFDNREVFGETNATGDALNSSPGEVPMEAMKGSQNQAYLGRMTAAGNDGANAAAAMIGASSPQEQIAPHPKVEAQAAQEERKAQQEVKPVEVTQSDNVPLPPPQKAQTAQQAQQAQQAQPETPAQVAQASPAVQGAPGAPGPKNGAANPAPHSDQDSDPFSDQNSFKFVNGHVSARNGRQVKTVKPQILNAGLLDLANMENRSVTFLATIDATGNVIKVRRYRSSGSDNVDLPCEEALNQWWIEPSKDKSGKPVGDVVSITFAFY
jgi:hypothetical protein